MINLELIFPTETRTLSFDNKIDTVRPIWKKNETDYYPSRGDTFKEYLSYSHLGTELLFKDGVLASISMYIFDESEEYKPFIGSFSHLNEEFWRDPSLNRFEEFIVSEGFEPMKTGSRFTTKYVKGDLYSIYSNDPDTKNIAFGLQSRL